MKKHIKANQGNKMTNTSEDLNNHLFASLEKLSNASKEDVETEVERSTAIVNVASKVIANAQVSLEAEKLRAHYAGFKERNMPALLENKANRLPKPTNHD